MTPPRKFLAAQGRAGNGHGYLTQPQRPLPEVADPPEVIARIADHASLCDEPESTSDAWVEAQADLNRTYDRMRHDAEVERAQKSRKLVGVELRMVEAQRRAKLQHVDISGELHVINCMLQRARKGGRHEPPAAVNRLERVEARLDHRPDLDDIAA